MARSEVILVEDVWTLLNTGRCVVTVKVEDHKNRGALLVNDTNSDTAAEYLESGGVKGTQFYQITDGAQIWAKATSPGWVLIVDPE